MAFMYGSPVYVTYFHYIIQDNEKIKEKHTERTGVNARYPNKCSFQQFKLIGIS